MRSNLKASLQCKSIQLPPIHFISCALFDRAHNILLFFYQPGKSDKGDVVVGARDDGTFLQLVSHKGRYWLESKTFRYWTPSHNREEVERQQ